MAATKPTWRNVKQAISHWSDEQLRGLMQDLYGLNTVNADFLPAQLLADTADDQLLDPYKKTHPPSYLPRRNFA